MNSIVNALEKHGLVDPKEVVRRIATTPYPNLCTIAEDLHGALGDMKSAEDDGPVESLNLLASSSIRGARCAGCAPKKLAALARYAALYSDRVIVPFAFAIPSQDSPDSRMDTTNRILQLMHIRPVIEADVLRVMLPEFHFCSECSTKAKHILRDVGRASREFVESHIGDFRFIYRRKDSFDFLEIQGPRRYLDHGAGVLFFKPPNWAPKRLYNIDGGQGKILSSTAVRRNNLLRHVVEGFAEDLIFQQLYGYKHGTKYLTDLPGEAEFFGMTSRNDELARRTRALCAGLSHNIPLMRDVPLATVLRIRRQDPGSFILYRRALSKILQDYLCGHDEISEADAAEIYRDLLQPELVKLKREATAQRRTKRAKIVVKTILPTTLVTLGVISGLLPNDIAQLAKIIGATTLLNQATDALLDQAGAGQVRNHNLYFLLRLAEEDTSGN
jgi:hypothetical protein